MNNIGGINGYGNYGVGGYIPQRNNGNVNSEETNQEQQSAANQQETQVDPAEVMAFLDKYNYFIPQATESAGVAEVGAVDAETEDRIAGYMAQFEFIYGVVQEEFGEALAPAVMDVVMDKLMGMV